MEALVVQEPWSSLFTEKEVEGIVTSSDSGQMGC
jgi:hypothetical protein